MVVTIFVPIYDGLFDEDYGPHVFEGRLSRERVFEICRGFGSGYQRAAICGNLESGWWVSFCNEDNPPVLADSYNEAFGERYDETVAGCGKLAYDVVYRTVLPY